MSKIKKLLIISFLTIIASSVWFYSHKEIQAENAVRSFLAGKGITDVAITISECGLYACRIPELRIGEDITVKDIWAQYDPQSIVEKKITFLQIASIALHVRNQNGKFSLGGLEKLWSADSTEVAKPFILNLPLKALLIGGVELQYTADNNTQTLETSQISLQEDSQEAAHYLLKVFQMKHIQDHPFIVPLDLSLRLSLESNELQLDGNLQSQDNHIKVPLLVRWNNVENSFTASAKLEQINFEAGILQPDELFPVLAGKVSQVSGIVALQSNISWKSGLLKTPTRISLNGLSMDAFGVNLDRATGIIAFDSILPPKTEGKQTIDVQRLTAGVPLENGKIQFEFAAKDMLVLHPMKWGWAGGSLVTDRLQINWKNPVVSQVKLHVRQVDLQSLMSLVVEKDMLATGKLDGTIPVRFAKGRVLIDQASLSSTSAGTVQYTSSDPAFAASGGASTELLAQALKDFHFTLLSMKVNSGEDGKALVALQVKGANPALYEGKPIELNVNLQGNLEEIIRQGMNVYAIPTTLEHQLMEQKP
jgi:hypothetical protein